MAMPEEGTRNGAKMYTNTHVLKMCLKRCSFILFVCNSEKGASLTINWCENHYFSVFVPGNTTISTTPI